MDAADDECPAEPFDAETPLFILYTSGSTAKPKGILHTSGGYLTHVAYTHKVVFDLKPDEDVYWCSADVGWITGHSYIVYGPLANGATSVMWEGGPDYPHKGIWWELCEKYGVTKFYTAPTAIRACMKWGVEHVEKADLSKLKLLGTVGEPINPKAWLWYYKVVGGERCPIVDTWWQTETGGIMITTLPGVAADEAGDRGQADAGHQGAGRHRGGRGRRHRAGPAHAPAPVARDAAHDLQGGRPLHRDVLRQVRQGDRTSSGTPRASTRTATSRSSGASTTSSTSPATACPPPRSSPRSSRTRRSPRRRSSARPTRTRASPSPRSSRSRATTTTGSDELVEELREHVAKRIGKLARPKRIIWAGDLPKTRSGKIMRRLLRDIAEGKELGDVTTLRDPDVVKDLEGKFAKDED